MSSTGTPVLPDDIVKRIAEEEKLRALLREQLESSSRVWKFLNSSFGLLLFTSIIVTGIGGLFNYLNQRAKDNANLREQEKKLLTEYDFRLGQIDNFIFVISHATDPENQGGFLQYLQRVAGGDPAFQPALPEFKQVHMAALVIQLDSLGISENASEAIAATEDLSNGYVVVNGKDLRTPGGFRFLPLDYIQLRSKVLHKFSESSWKMIEPRRKPGIPILQ